MNALTNLTTAKALTMSSREIADLTEKLHANVLRDIRNLLADPGEAELNFESSYRDTTGRTLPMFNLPKDLTLTLVAGYSAALRHRIITRWMELEEAAKGPALPNFGNPAEAARAWALEFERAEEQARLAVEHAKKVEALEVDLEVAQLQANVVAKKHEILREHARRTLPGGWLPGRKLVNPVGNQSAPSSSLTSTRTVFVTLMFFLSCATQSMQPAPCCDWTSGTK